MDALLEDIRSNVADREAALCRGGPPGRGRPPGAPRGGQGHTPPGRGRPNRGPARWPWSGFPPRNGTWSCSSPLSRRKAAFSLGRRGARKRLERRLEDGCFQAARHGQARNGFFRLRTDAPGFVLNPLFAPLPYATTRRGRKRPDAKTGLRRMGDSDVSAGPNLWNW